LSENQIISTGFSGYSPLRKVAILPHKAFTGGNKFVVSLSLTNTAPAVGNFGFNWVEMKSLAIPSDSGHSITVGVHPSGPRLNGVDSLVHEEESSLIPLHPLGLKPSGNQYTATSNARYGIGSFQVLPDEIIAVFLEYLDSLGLRLLGSTCKALYAFCRSDDLWKTLLIE
jgi:hypothetical protein